MTALETMIDTICRNHASLVKCSDDALILGKALEHLARAANISASTEVVKSYGQVDPDFVMPGEAPAYDPNH